MTGEVTGEVGAPPEGGGRNTAARRPEEAPAGLASALMLEIGRKPVVRELHDAAEAEDGAARWRARGYAVEVGDEVREAADSAAMVTETQAHHTVRPLATHPVVERAVALGGGPARWLLLDARSPVYRRLRERLGADVHPEDVPRPSGATARPRRALYVSRDAALAARARELDRMAADDARSDPAELGRLLGYPACCVEAFCALERRWPNRLPIEAAMARTAAFLPRLNNLALDRFAWIAHFPCRYDCPASRELADAAAEALAARNPELVAAVDALLALPRAWRSDAAQAVLLGARPDGPGRIRFDRLAPLDALWPRPGSAPAAPADAWADLAGADAARVTPDGAIFTAGGRELRIDDRPLLLPFGLSPGPNANAPAGAGPTGALG